MKGIWDMGKLMMRSDLASEAIWRPKNNLLEKIWLI